MKQHITIEQLNELSLKGKRKLFERMLRTKNFEANLLWVESPLLTIGQMIEFLSDKHDNFTIGKISSWYIDLDISDGSHDVYDVMELCDALWEAVKEELNK